MQCIAIQTIVSRLECSVQELFPKLVDKAWNVSRWHHFACLLKHMYSTLWIFLSSYVAMWSITTFERPHVKTNKVACAPSKNSDQPGHQPSLISLHCPAWRKLCSLVTQWVHSEDSDQTGWMPRLIRVFPGRKVILLVLSWGGSYMVAIAMLPIHVRNTLKYLGITSIRTVSNDAKPVRKVLILMWCKTYFLPYTYTNLWHKLKHMSHKIMMFEWCIEQRVVVSHFACTGITRAFPKFSKPKIKWLSRNFVISC